MKSRRWRLALALALCVGCVAVAVALLWLHPRLYDGQGLLATYRTPAGPSGQTDGEPILERVELAIDGDRGRWPEGLPTSGFRVTWQGTIVFPRARYYIAIESDPPARIFLDDRPVAGAIFPYDKGRPVGRPTLVDKAGPHALRIEFDAGNRARPRIRLLWLPPGRRGVPEYIPPLALFPASPDQLGPDDLARARGDFRPSGWIALALVVTLMLALGVWFRPHLAAWLAELGQDRADGGARVRHILVALAICAGAAALRFWDLSGAGATWDEDVHRDAGLNYVLNLLSMDFRPFSWRWIAEHPTVTMYFYGLGALFEDGYALQRAMAVMAGAATVGFTMLIARRLFEARTACIAGVLYALLPLAIAMHKNVSHEAVVGLTWSAALYAFLGALDRPTWRRWIVTGVLCGLAVGSRVTSGVLVFLTAALFLLDTLSRPREERAAIWRRSWQPVLLVWPVAFLVFIAVWPYMWSGLFGKIAAMFGVHGAVTANEMYLGALIKKPPWHYLPVYFCVTVPAAFLAALAVGTGRGLWCVARRQWRAGEVVVLLWVFFAFTVALGPAIKDGARYFFPGFGAAAILAARGLMLLPGRACWITSAAVAVYMLIAGITVHPYYLDYYNLLTGGPGQVQRHRTFEISWWGEGLEAATDYVAKVAPPGATIWLAAEPKHVMTWRDDLVRMDRPGADYVIHNQNVWTRPFRTPGYEVVFEARAGGAVISTVWKRVASPDSGP